MGVGVWGLGFGVWGLGFGVEGSGFGFWAGALNLLWRHGRLIQTFETNVDYRAASFKAQDLADILDQDLIFSVALISIKINFRLPIFLKWDVRTQGAGAPRI